VIAIRSILSTEERHAQMQKAVITGLPFLKKQREFHEEFISIVCYGPSLAETWHDINGRDYLPILTVSGAHDFLIERGVRPSIHVHLDPRPFEREMLSMPNDSTRYLMASVCPPEFWNVLEGRRVELWHLINGPETVEWVRKNHPDGLDSMIGGGSTVGQRALNVAAALGYRRFRIFGMDCSFGPAHWAGPHPGNEEPIIKVEMEGRKFKTTPHLWKAAREMAEMLQTADIEVEFHGDGLMQTVAKSIKQKRSL
jgi:uncharacterized Rossmann fold enzyme